jgi:hypothetical protein
VSVGCVNRPIQMKGLDTVNGNGVLDEALDRGDAIAQGDENGGFGGVLMQDKIAVGTLQVDTLTCVGAIEQVAAEGIVPRRTENCRLRPLQGQLAMGSSVEAPVSNVRRAR